MEKGDLKKSLLDEEEQKVAKTGVEPTVQEKKNGVSPAKKDKKQEDEGKGWNTESKETKGI